MAIEQTQQNTVPTTKATVRKRLEVIASAGVIPLESRVRNSDVRACAYSRSGAFLAWSQGFLVKVLRVRDENGEPMNPSQQLTLNCISNVRCLAFLELPKKNLAVCSGRKASFTFTDFRKVNDTLLAAGSEDGKIRIWSANTGRLYMHLWDHKQIVTSIEFDPTGSLTLLSASKDATCKLWDLQDGGNMFKTLKEHKSLNGFCIDWSKNGSLVATGGADSQVFLWKVSGWSVLFRMKGHLNTVSALSFSPDGALLASASHDTTVVIWNTATGQSLQQLCHMVPMPRPIFASGYNDHFVRSVAFCKDGNRLFTTCDNGTVNLWGLNCPLSPPLASLEIPNPISCSFAPNGTEVLVGSKNGQVSLVSVQPFIPSLLHMSRSVICHCLTSPENVNALPIPPNMKDFLLYQYS
jgi:WD repeat/SOCS box-containing protein 1